ncbi:hypothetical protein [Enterococcus sp. LJL120]
MEPSLAATDKFELFSDGLTDYSLTIQEGKVAYLESKIKLAEDENESYKTKISELERDVAKLDSANSDLEKSYEQLAEADQSAIQEKIASNTSTKEQKLSEVTDIEEEISSNEDRITSFERLLEETHSPKIGPADKPIFAACEKKLGPRKNQTALRFTPILGSGFPYALTRFPCEI